MMFSKLALSFILTNFISVCSLAEPVSKIKIKDSDIVEFIFFAQANKANLGDFVKTSLLSEEHKRQVQNFLTSQGLSKANIDVQWKYGSKELTITGAGSNTTLDFNNFVATRNVQINGTNVEINNHDFSTVVASFQKVLNATVKPTAYQLFLPSALAVEKPSTGSVFFGIAYWTGLDQLMACFNNREIIAGSSCKLRSNSSMILSRTAPSSITQFSCSDKGFHSMSIHKTDPDTLVSLNVNYASNGDVNQIGFYQDGSLVCKYVMKNGQLTGVESAIAGNPYCDGRTIDEYAGGFHTLHAGDRPKFLATFPVPFPRLQQCCQDEQCKKDILSHVQVQSGKSTQPNSAQ